MLKLKVTKILHESNSRENKKIKMGIKISSNISNGSYQNKINVAIFVNNILGFGLSLKEIWKFQKINYF